MAELYKSLPQTIKELIAKWCVDNVETQAPAIITNIDKYATERVVDVMPLTVELESDGDALVPTTIYSVPVILQANLHGFLSYPLKVGDTVSIGYCKRSTEEFTSGTTTNQYIPVDGRVFSASDPVVLGYWAQQSKDLPIPTDRAIFKYKELSVNLLDSGSVIIENPNGNITLHNSGNIFANGCIISTGGNVTTENGTNLDQLKTDFDALKAEYDVHVHNTANGPTDGPQPPSP